jgi:predicted transcriptional regulator
MSKRTEILFEQLIELAPDDNERERLMAMRNRMRVPMKDILEKIEGDSFAAKAKLIGITRQTVYSYLQGIARPSGRVARRVAELSGFSVDAVRGRGHAEPN